MDILDKKFKVKRFLKTLYRAINFEEEQIRTLSISKDGTYSKASYFNDIDELVEYSVNKYTRFNNTYFELATTDGEGGATEHLKYRYFLAFDFDKKDLGD